MDTFAERLKYCREQKGWSQKDLVKASGVAISSIEHYEANKNLPNIVLLQWLCNALEVSSYDLIESKYTTSLSIDLNNFAERLKYYREQKGLSQKELVALTGISISRIKDYEHNRGTPNVIRLYKLCDALEVSTEALLGF